MSFRRKFFLNVCIYENMLEQKGANQHTGGLFKIIEFKSMDIVLIVANYSYLHLRSRV